MNVWKACTTRYRHGALDEIRWYDATSGGAVLEGTRCMDLPRTAWAAGPPRWLLERNDRLD